MTTEQFAKLIEAISQLSSKSYTLTSAADWPILVTVGGILFTMIVMMWTDLKNTIKDHRGEWQHAIDRHTAENEKEIKIIWDAMRECQSDCCPRKK